MKVAIFGDICLQHRDLIEKSWTDPVDIHDSVKEFTLGIDFSIANLENPLFGDERTRNRDKLALHASPKTLSLLRALKVDTVSLANNHIMDYGAEAGLVTIKLLEEEGIKWFGAGYAGSEGNPAILEKNGVSLACLGYSHPPCEEFYSSAECFGSARYSKSDFEYLVADLRQKADHILVFMHWGIEDISYPVPENMKTAHEIIDMGADLVIGCHPHVYQGFEIYRGKYILYSLGNFIFGDILAKTIGDQIFTRKQSWRNRIGLVPVFLIDKSSIHLDGLHFFQFRKDNAIVKVTGPAEQLHSFCFRRLSSRLQSSSDRYAQWWRRNRKLLVFLKLLERVALKGSDFRPGRRHLGMLKELIVQDSDTLG